MAAAESRMGTIPILNGAAPDPVALGGRVMGAVCEASGLTPARLLCSSQRPENAWPRFVAIALVRERTRLSWPKIAQLFERSYHETVMRGAKRVPEIEPSEPALKALRLHAEEILNGRCRGQCEAWLTRVLRLREGYRTWRRRTNTGKPTGPTPDLTEGLAEILRIVIKNPCADLGDLAGRTGIGVGPFSRQIERLVRSGHLARASEGLRVLRFPSGRPVPRPSPKDRDLVEAFIAEKGVTRCPPAILHTGQGYRRDESELQSLVRDG